MLYSFKGEYPGPLPNRIVLSNGRTRTDPSSFTPEEIEDAGFTLVNDPPIKKPYEKLIWDGANFAWIIQETRTLESAKRLKLNDLSVLRRRKETEFQFNQIDIYLDEKTQARINAAVAGFAFRPNDTVSWEVTRGTFVDFDKTTMEILAVAAWTHVKLCYDNVKALTQQIQACNTIQEVDAIDLTIGWPDYSG